MKKIIKCEDCLYYIVKNKKCELDMDEINYTDFNRCPCFNLIEEEDKK